MSAQPELGHLNLVHELGELDSPESLSALHDAFAEMEEDRLNDIDYRSGYMGDYDIDYKQVQFNWRERGATGMESDPRMK